MSITLVELGVEYLREETERRGGDREGERGGRRQRGGEG